MKSSNIKRVAKKVVPPKIFKKMSAVIRQNEINRIEKIKVAPFNGAYAKGVNLIGSFQHDSGLGQSCRLLAKEIKETGLNYSFLDISAFSEVSKSDYGYGSVFSDECQYGVNIWHVNMHEFAKAIKMVGVCKLNGHKNIAFWLWEMEEFPAEWIPLIHVLDEIWTPSEFVSGSLRKVTQKPVVTVPYAMETPYDHTVGRAYFGLPLDKFLYLMVFDTHSILERKNPQAILRAFKQAFAPLVQRVGLVIKISHLEDCTKRWIDEEMKGYNIYYVNKMLSKERMNALIKLVDVYVSLHRTEGFGLVLAESMFLGTPTIATNYSANTEFQTKDTACLVDYIKVPVGSKIQPYKKTNMWAEPDTGQAARYMRKLYEDPLWGKELACKAKGYVGEQLNMDWAVSIIGERITQIYKG